MDFYGKDLGLKLYREYENKNQTLQTIPEEIEVYISNKVKELVHKYENFEERGSIIDYIINITFISNTYIATNSQDKQSVISDIMQYFYKFNTRGKGFNEQETLDILKKLIQ